jgi:hypothetical protein
MYISHEWRADFFLNRLNCNRVKLVRNGKAYDIRARVFKRGYLLDRLFHVRGFRRRHRLNFYSFATADFNIPNGYEFGFRHNSTF